MSKREDFHPSLSTLDVAKFQLMENGFAGVTNGVTMVPENDLGAIEANHLLGKITDLVDKAGLDDRVTLLSCLTMCKAFLEQYREDPACAVLVVFRPSVREGEANVQPVAKIIDPWEVIEPEFAHTDGAGNVKEQNGGVDNTSSDARRSKGNGADN